MQKKSVIHHGTVKGLTDNTLLIELKLRQDDGECASCALSAACTKSEKLSIKLPCPDGIDRNNIVGRTATVAALATSPANAALLLLVLPLSVLMAAVIGLSAAGVPDIWSGLAAFVAAGLCYIALYFCRRQRLEWRLIEIDKLS